MDSSLKWLYSLRNSVNEFLQTMRGSKVKGFYKYSYSGDIYGESVNWGLGNTVFAIKTYFTIGHLNELAKQDKSDMADFIKSFERRGSIYDPLVRKKSIINDIKTGIKNLNISYIKHLPTIRAETRQSIAALSMLGIEPETVYTGFPLNETAIKAYLESFDWSFPWSAGSHFSHLMFFLNRSTVQEKDKLIEYSIKWLYNIQSQHDGAWYKGAPSLVEKINGAMKIITGLAAAGINKFPYSEKLIDTCLGLGSTIHACDNFNVIYVLKCANEAAGSAYRNDEIKQFACRFLERYKEYYFPAIGGFSFYKHRANSMYYGARITLGLDEPDIHGTCLFCWGIAVIASILNIQNELGFKEFRA